MLLELVDMIIRQTPLTVRNITMFGSTVADAPVVLVINASNLQAMLTTQPCKARFLLFFEKVRPHRNIRDGSL